VSNFIGIYNELFPADFCERLIAEHNRLQNISSHNPIGVQRGQDFSEQRRDLSFFFNLTSQDMCGEVNNYLNVALSAYYDEHPALDFIPLSSYEIKVQETLPKGGFHVFHYEQAHATAHLRQLAWMVYLNDTEEGDGTTEFLEQGLRVQPKQGTVVIFPAGWTHTHRGNPVYKSTKYIATGWYFATE